MSSTYSVASALNDPRRLEEMYRTAEAAGDVAVFRSEIDRLYTQSPDNLLLAAWYYRLQPGPTSLPVQARAGRIHWHVAIPLGLLLGMVYWILSGDDMILRSGTPYLLFLWAPLAAAAIMGLTTLGAPDKKSSRLAVGVIVALVALDVYAMWSASAAHGHYEGIAAIHLPILALAGIGLTVAGRGADDHNRFAFLIKSAEAVVTGGIYGGTTLLFLAVTAGIFGAIGIHFTHGIGRLVASLAAGLVPVLAVATVYDPRFSPVEQRFDEGLSKLIFTLGRFFLPLTLAVGVAYTVFIPFNFWRPFEARDVLIIYNLMLFAVMGLLVFATPVSAASLPSTVLVWLRRGITAVAALTILVSLYALSATAYRTAMGGITINRLTIIGWNVINILLLADVVYSQVRAGATDWPSAIWRTCRRGMIAYTLWALFLVLAIPWLFPA